MFFPLVTQRITSMDTGDAQFAAGLLLLETTHCFYSEAKHTGEIYHVVHEQSIDPSKKGKFSAVISPNLLFKTGGSSSQPTSVFSIVMHSPLL